MTTTADTLVTVITVNYNSKDETLDFIHSLKKNTHQNWELIVVDNASKEDPSKDILRICPEAKVIVSKENLGFAGGNNLGLNESNGEYVFFVNNDTILPADCLSSLLETASQLLNLGALSPKFEFFHTPGLLEYAGATNISSFTARNKLIGNCKPDQGYTGLIETYYMHGGGMLIPQKVINTVGPMEEQFFLYYEEMDWSERIRKAGFQIYCQREIKIYHKESASVGKMSPLKAYYLNRNRILFMKRNYPFPKIIPFTLFFMFVSFPKNIITYLFKGQPQHLRAFCRGVFYHFNSKLNY